MPHINALNISHFYTASVSTATPKATLVFVHGWLLSHQYWQPVVDLLEQDFDCYCYDLRGFGASQVGKRQRSPSPSTPTELAADYSLAAYAEDLHQLLQALNISSAWLIGHSLGGSIALWAAKLFPEIIQGVICVNAGGGVYLPQEFARFRQAGQQIVRWRRRWLTSVPFLSSLFATLMVYKPLSVEWGAQRLHDLLAAQGEAAMGALLDSTTEAEVHRLPQVVAALQQPAYFIAGAQDRVMEEKYVRHLASFHPLFKHHSGNVTILPECGHMAMVERPRDLAETIQTCLAPHLATQVGAGLSNA